MGPEAARTRTPAVILERAVPLVLGAGAALGHAPFSLPIATVVALSLFIAWLGPAAPHRAGRAGLLFGLGYFAVTLHWIVQPFMVDAARHGWMAPFALFGLAGGMALYWGAGLWLAARVAGRAGPLVVFFGLGVAEMIRSGLFGGFPWALIGSVWVDGPLRAAAAWGGVHGLTLLTLGLGAGLAQGLERPRRAIVITCVSAGVLVAAAILAARSPGPEPAGLTVRVVQANAVQHLKWRPDMIPVFWQRRLALTAVAAEPAPDVVIWPEVALPYLLGSDPEADGMIAQAAGGATVLAGAQRRAGAALHNSLAVITPDGAVSEIYDKHHLVPFGEYVPGGALAARLGLTGLATDALGAFTPGPGPRVLDLSDHGLGRVAPLICYEAIFPRYGHLAAPRPDWFVQVTNDAWFGRFAGPQQHLDLARLRATEQGLPLVRAANTGISAVIGPRGEVLGRLALDKAGYLDVALPAALPPTPYARLGNAPVWAVLLAVALLLGWRRRAVTDA